MDLQEICQKALFRYNEGSKSLLQHSLNFDTDRLQGKFICPQPYLKHGDSSSAMNNTDFMLLSNQACYLIIYCYFMNNLGYSLDRVNEIHGNIAIYKQSFVFKNTVNANIENEFQAKIDNFRKKSFSVDVEVNGGDYTTHIKLVLLKDNIHF